MYDVITDVMSKKAKIKSSKSRVYAIFVTKMCAYVVKIGVRVHLTMAFIKINSIKYKLCKYLLSKA